jgi:hypothetical protein
VLPGSQGFEVAIPSSISSHGSENQLGEFREMAVEEVKKKK